MSNDEHNANYAYVGLGVMLSMFIIIGSYLHDKEVDHSDHRSSGCMSHWLLSS
jgi:hypothetical protein